MYSLVGVVSGDRSGARGRVDPSASIAMVKPNTSSPMMVSAPTANVSSIWAIEDADWDCDSVSDWSDEIVIEIDNDGDPGPVGARDTDPLGVD